MDLMFLNADDRRDVKFDIEANVISNDRFFEYAQKYISVDENTLLYRQSLFSDILKIDGISDFLISLLEKLNEYAPLIQLSNQKTNTEEAIRSLLYPSAYVELVRFICDSLTPIISKTSSVSLKQLYELAKSDIESDEYKRIKHYCKKSTYSFRSVSSVTVGVNLDAMYRPKEAGIISLNNEKFKSGDLLDRIIKLDFEKDEYHCIAPLTVIDKKLGFDTSQQVNYAVLKALEKVLCHGLHHCGNRLLNYIRERLSKYFEYLDSLKFVVEAIKHIKIFTKNNIPLCFPNISRDKSFSVVSLYDGALCRAKEKKDIVPNTVFLESNIYCYILTGANSSGKTVFINSLATAQYYFQLGMPIPAKEATLPICDAIFKISVEKQLRDNFVGRFEKECISLSDVLKKFTPNSLALIDEALTSTSPAEAIPIAVNFISELCKRGGKCIFITHYRELCQTKSKLLECSSRLDFLHTGSKTDYTVHKGISNSESSAQIIAKKYGLISDY